MQMSPEAAVDLKEVLYSDQEDAHFVGWVIYEVERPDNGQPYWRPLYAENWDPVVIYSSPEQAEQTCIYLIQKLNKNREDLWVKAIYTNDDGVTFIPNVLWGPPNEGGEEELSTV